MNENPLLVGPLPWQWLVEVTRVEAERAGAVAAVQRRLAVP